MVIGRVIAHPQHPDDAAPHALHEANPAARVLDHLDAVEARAQRGGVGRLAAQAAADAAVC
jgi:hypothetical protein